VGAPLGNLVRLVYRGLAKALETGTLLHRGPVKYHGGRHLSLSLYGSSVRGALRVMKGRLWGRASLLMGAQLGNLEWAHLPATLRDG